MKYLLCILVFHTIVYIVILRYIYKQFYTFRYYYFIFILFYFHYHYYSFCYGFYCYYFNHYFYYYYYFFKFLSVLWYYNYIAIINLLSEFFNWILLICVNFLKLLIARTLLCWRNVYHIKDLRKKKLKNINLHYVLAIMSTFPYFAYINLFSSHL